MNRPAHRLCFGGLFFALASGGFLPWEAVASQGVATAPTRPGRPAEASPGRNQNLITRLCIAGFNAAMSDAGKVAPAGMETFTCDCFLEEVIGGRGIQAAQTVCRTRAAARYRL